MEFQRIGVIGCGLMGSGIADVCARVGCDVIVREQDEAALENGRRAIGKNLARAVKSGKMSEEDSEAIFGRVTFTRDFEAMADRQLVVEAVYENEEIKVDIFRRLDRIVSDADAILASNTSSIPIMKLGVATSRPEQVCGLHFFNPVPVLPLVELVPSLMTSAETAAAWDHSV